MKHTISINTPRTNCQIEIRLDDQRKNGHDDFAMTAIFWKPGCARTDRNWILGGCCHNEILKVRPKLAIFARLHLCDRMGTPMHAIENAWFHIREGQPQHMQSAFRVSDEEAARLAGAFSFYHFVYLVWAMDLRARWEAEANEAIKMLEEMTGETYTPQSEGVRLIQALSWENVCRFAKLDASGFFTPENRERRKRREKQAAINKLISGARARYRGEEAAARAEMERKIAVFKAGVTSDNFILYPHKANIEINWINGWKKMPDDQVEAIKAAVAAGQIPGIETVTVK